MLSAFISFHRGLLKMGPGVLLWLVLLVGFNGLLPVYFWPAPPAIITAVVFLTGYLAMILLTYFFGFTRMLGLGHLLWIPLVIYLLFHIDLENLGASMQRWMSGVILLNSISLIIDISDVVRYINGDRAPLVEGL